MRVLITGHTGFKGSWLTLLLAEMGHEVHGYSLREETESLYRQAQIADFLKSSTYGDIRNQETFKNAILSIKPDVLIHMAAQAFVLEGYLKPIETFETNFTGTLNVLRFAQEHELRAVLIVTTDKVYKIIDGNHKYKESDYLGGSDPYSASKVAADVAAQSIAKLSEKSVISIARAGNVVGGGDYGSNRIIPDLFRAAATGTRAVIRNPGAIRPWQHVLDCLYGYWRIIENSLENSKSEIWNIGPSDNLKVSVSQICESFQRYFSLDNLIEVSKFNSPQETNYLRLDSSKIYSQLGWRNRLGTEQSLAWTFDWYKDYLAGNSAQSLTLKQINEYLQL